MNHVLPKVTTPLIVQDTLDQARAILSPALLSLGLGAQLPTSELGQMLGAEQNRAVNAPHLVLFPGTANLLAVLSFHRLGDGRRDASDPSLSQMGIKVE